MWTLSEVIVLQAVLYLFNWLVIKLIKRIAPTHYEELFKKDLRVLFLFSFAILPTIYIVFMPIAFWTILFFVWVGEGKFLTRIFRKLGI